METRHPIKRLLVTVGITAGLFTVAAGQANAAVVPIVRGDIHPSPTEETRCPTLLSTTSTASRSPGAPVVLRHQSSTVTP